MLSATKFLLNKSQKNEAANHVFMYLCLHNESMAEKWANHHTGHIIATKQPFPLSWKKKKPDSGSTEYNVSVGLMTVKMEIERYRN